MTTELINDLYRACVKLYAPEPPDLDDAAEFVPIFHEWIRDQVLDDLISVDVADYAHAPVSPGIMLVCHEASFALDRSDGRFGLLAQRRVRIDGDATQALATTLRHALQVAERLERDPRLVGRLEFDMSTLRFEANDRLLAPNTDEAFSRFEPLVRRVVGSVFPDRAIDTQRIDNDPRDRLAVAVHVHATARVPA